MRSSRPHLEEELMSSDPQSAFWLKQVFDFLEGDLGLGVSLVAGLALLLQGGKMSYCLLGESGRLRWLRLHSPG